MAKHPRPFLFFGTVLCLRIQNKTSIHKQNCEMDSEQNVVTEKCRSTAKITQTSCVESRAERKIEAMIYLQHTSDATNHWDGTQPVEVGGRPTIRCCRNAHLVVCV
jgi:hypothetical protein